MAGIDTESDSSATQRIRATRRQVLKAGAAGAALVWAVPVVEAFSPTAAATSPAPSDGGANTNISWVALVFQDTSTGSWYLWNGGFVSSLTGIGNLPPGNFAYFAFYDAAANGKHSVGGFTTPGPGLTVTPSFDASGNMDLAISGASSGIALQYVIVHGGANAYNGSTGSVVASDGSGSYASKDTPAELNLAVPSGLVVANDLQYFQTPIVGGTQYTLGYVVGNT